MTVLTIPPLRAEDVQPAKDFLFAVYGESRWTEENYLAMSERTKHIVELSEGRLIVPAMPTSEHQRIVRRLFLLLHRWAAMRASEVFFAPMPVRLWPGKFREPDVFLYTAEHRDRVGEQYGGVPDLAVEVLSPSTEKTDTDEKMGEYAQAGVPEYWVVSVDEVRVEQYVLEGPRYRLHAALGAGDTVRAATLTDLEIAVDELYTSN